MQCKTGSKILTEPEPDRIGIIWLKKLTGFGRIDRIGRIFTEFKKKTFSLNLQVTNINMAASYYKA